MASVLLASPSDTRDVPSQMLHFFRMDPGLDRRFPSTGWLELPNYTSDELARISEVVATSRFDKQFAPGLLPCLSKHISDFHHRDIAQQNGGLAVNLTEQAVNKQIARVFDTFKERLERMDTVPEGPAGRAEREALNREMSVKAAVLEPPDFGIESGGPSLGRNELKLKVEAKIASLVGLENVKTYFADMARRAAYVERGGNPQALRTSLNLILTGNAGVGASRQIFAKARARASR